MTSVAERRTLWYRYTMGTTLFLPFMFMFYFGQTVAHGFIEANNHIGIIIKISLFRMAQLNTEYIKTLT